MFHISWNLEMERINRGLNMEKPVSPRSSLLDSVGAVFAINERERQRRLSVQRDKHEGERAHSRYLKSVLHPGELAQAKTVVNQWAKKHDKVGNSNRRFFHNSMGRILTPSAVRTRVPLRDKEPNTMPEIIDLAASPEVNSPISRSQRNSLGSRSHSNSSASRSNDSSFSVSRSHDSSSSTSRSHDSSSSASRSHDFISLVSRSPDSNSSASGSLGYHSSSILEPAKRTSRANRGQDSSLIIISDNESDEDLQFEMAILRSLEETSSNIETVNTTNSTKKVEDRNSNSGIETIIVTDSSTTPSLYICSVLNCETAFETEAKLAEHLAALKHSPCNPCRLITDCKLPSDILAYACPECGELFQAEVNCTEHMCDKGHRSFLPAVPVSGYMCPQCLMLFGKEESCQAHISHQRHVSYSFPFSDDISSVIQGFPVAVSSGFAHDFFLQCVSTAYSLFCIDCSANVECKDEPTHRHTHPDHIVSSSSKSTPLEVFMNYLSCLQCNNCGVLLSTSEAQLDDMHECIGDQWGIMEEMQTQTFMEFVRLIGLKFILQFMGGFVTISSTFGSDHNVACVEDGADPLVYPKSSNSRTGQLGTKRKVCGENDSSSCVSSSPKVMLFSSAGAQKDHIYNEEKTPTSETGSNTYPTKAYLPSSILSLKKRDNDCMESTAATCSTIMPRESKRTRFSPLGDATQPFAKQKPFLQHNYQRLKSSAYIGINQRPRHDRFRQVKRPSRFQPQSQTVGNLPPIKGHHVDCAVPTATSFKPPLGVSQLPPLPGPEQNISSEPPSVGTLSKLKLLIFLDLDNWPSFFKRLPRCLPDSTFVWAFWGGATQWREPTGFYSFTEQKRKGMFYLNKRSGRTKDAADFSLVLQVGMMNALLPKTVPFTILSGDRGFCQVEKEICASDRRLVLIDPHRSSKESPEMFYTLIISVFQD